MKVLKFYYQSGKEVESDNIIDNKTGGKIKKQLDFDRQKTEYLN